MSHVRQQIREALVTALTGLTTTAARVYPFRGVPLADAKLPCLLVNTDEESVEAGGISAPFRLERNLTVRVRGLAKQVDNLDDKLDTIAAEVETALGNTTLGGLVKMLSLSGVNISRDDDGERPVGEVEMVFSAVYVTAANAPESII